MKNYELSSSNKENDRSLNEAFSSIQKNFAGSQLLDIWKKR